MQTFRGPHPHQLPGMSNEDSSDEEGDEDLVVIQPVFLAGLDDSDESDSEDDSELGEAQQNGSNNWTVQLFQPSQAAYDPAAAQGSINIHHGDGEDIDTDDDDDDDDDSVISCYDSEEEIGIEDVVHPTPNEDVVLGHEQDNDNELEEDANVGSINDNNEPNKLETEDIILGTPTPTPPEEMQNENDIEIDGANGYTSPSAKFSSSDSDQEYCHGPGNKKNKSDDHGNAKASTSGSAVLLVDNDDHQHHKIPGQDTDYEQRQLKSSQATTNLDIEMSRADDSSPDPMSSSPVVAVEVDDGDPISNRSQIPHASSNIQHESRNVSTNPCPCPNESIPIPVTAPSASPILHEQEQLDFSTSSMDTTATSQKSQNPDKLAPVDYSDSDPDLNHEAMEHEGDDDDEDDEEEQFCNPMVSTVDDQENEDVLRGDRIGSTTYSERHVLKILMNWVEKLPQFAPHTIASSKSEINPAPGPASSETSTSSPVSSVPVISLDKPLDEELEESMSLLWDMSTEEDVMYFLIDNNIFLLIRDNLDTAHCPTRLKEIALGILANLLSCSSILENFPEKDEHINLVDRVVVEALSSTAVPVLTQVFAVLRRVVCYIRNAKPLDRWMKLFLHSDFIQAANFLLASSTNVILLGDVIMMLFTLMEVLSPPQEFEFQNSSEVEKSKYEATMALNFKPFIQSEFVPSVCEGLNELLKDTRSGRSRLENDNEGSVGGGGGGSALGNNYLRSNADTDPVKLPHCPTTGNGPDYEDRDEFVIPPGHVQTACLNGLASLCYLQKFNAGKDVLKKPTNNKSLIEVLLSLFRKFRFCTERIEGADILDYYALAIDLLTQCHLELNQVLPPAIIIPTSATILLVEEEGKKENTQEHHKTHLVTIDNSGSGSPGPGQSQDAGFGFSKSSTSTTTTVTSLKGEVESRQNKKENESIEIQSSDVSPYSIILYNYLISCEEKFSQDQIQKVFQNSGKNKKKLSDFYSMVRQVAVKIHENKGGGSG